MTYRDSSNSKPLEFPVLRGHATRRGKEFEEVSPALHTAAGSCNDRKPRALMGWLWGRGVASSENDSTCPFNIALPSSVIFPGSKVEDTISIPLKNPIIAPSLGPPSPGSTPSEHRNKGQPVLG